MGSVKAPKGVPVLSGWKENRNGSITGFISGAPGYKNGEFITTSKIKGDVIAGTVVTTQSGSKYFLDPKSGETVPKTVAPKQQAPIKSSRTLSLFNFGGDNGRSSAPPGVPKLVNWRKNNDNSITGFISSSANFKEGEKITTSRIATGEIKAGLVVKTASGSRYFLV